MAHLTTSPAGADHRALIAGLSAHQRRAFMEQSDRPGLVRIAVHLGLILILGAWTALGAPGWPVAMAAQGVLIVFLFTCLHETVHFTAFRDDRLNRWVGWICGFAVCLPPVWFRYFHLAHHKHTHDPARDPELAQAKPATLAAYLWWLTGLPEFRDRVKTLIRLALAPCGDDFLPARARARVLRQARVFLGLYGALAALSVAAGTMLLVWCWILPMLIGGPALRAYLLAEHARCPHVADMLANTRTTFTNRLVRWIAWNMPYHAEHHALPGAPFHRLPLVHRAFADHLKSTHRGYADFNATYARDAAAGRLEG